MRIDHQKCLPPYQPKSLGKTVLAAAAGAVLLLAASNSNAALIGYWNLDEGTGTTAADTSGSPITHNGTLAQGGTGARPAWIAGRFGSALDFNRVNDANGSLITVPNNPELLLNNAFTISFWYRPGPNIGTFPGPMRIGNQSATTGTTIGWGFFRAQNGNRLTYKRGNAQPNVYPTALQNGQWYHIVIRHDGTSANTAIMFGVTTNNFTQAWLDGTSTAVFEFGRMDQFDDCDLDDIAFFDEALPLERINTINSVPAQLGLDYSLADVRALWSIFDAGAGSSGTVKGTTWSHTTTLPGSTTPGDAYLNGTKWYVVLAPGEGLVANATLLGDVSPAGVGTPGTQVFGETPTIGATARFVFDLGGNTTPGGVNDLLEINGDLNLLNNALVINPLTPLANGTYRLVNYSGTKSGSFNPNVIHNSRYTITLDESVTGQINVTVAGSNGDVDWNSTTSALWDLTSLNWLDTGTATPSAFFQGDSVSFDDSGAFQSNITIATDVYPSSVSVNSSTLNYTFSGSGKIGGAGNGIVKDGSSVLTLSSANSFVGPVSVNAGTLKLGNAASLGSDLGGTTIAGGATLDLGGAAPGTEGVTVEGAGVGGLGAIVNTGAGLVNTGLRGGVTLTGDTTFGGAVRWDVFGGTLAGNGHKLTKSGASEIALSQLGETGLGEIEIQQGILTILGTTLPGDTTKGITVRSNASLAFWATGDRVIDKPIVMEWGQMRNLTGGTDVTTNVGTINLTGNNTFNISAAIRLQGEVGGTGGINKIGAGTLALDTHNIYSGDTVISAGRLALGDEFGLGGTPTITINGGAVLDASAVSSLPVLASQYLLGSGSVHGNVNAFAGGTLSPGLSAGTLTITNALDLADGANLRLELSGVTTEGGGVNDLISVGGNLSLDGTINVLVEPTGPLDLANPYTLISYAGSLTGGAANFSAMSDTRMTFSFDTGTPGKILMTVASGAPELAEWTGGDPGAPNAWDVKTTPNWTTTIVPDQFYSGDTVVFNDLGAEFTVDLVGDLFPANTRVEADANDYLFTGSGRIRGGGLTKSLSGKLTLANSGINDYPGQTVISGGSIQIGVGGTAGSIGPASVINDGRLILNRSDDLTFGNTMTGSGVLEKQGNNLLTLPASMAGFNGTIAINGGLARPAATTGVGTDVGGVSVANGGTFDLNALNLGAEPFTIAGDGVGGNGALVNLAAGQNNALRFVTLGGDATIGGSGRWDIRNPGAGASLTGNGFSLTKKGANQVSLVGLGDTGLGGINVQQGLLSVEGTTGLGLSSGAVNVQSGATLMFWGNTVPQEKQFALNGGGRIFKDNGTVTLNGTMSLTASNALEAANNSGTDMVVGATISGTGSLNKLGAGNVILTANNNYSGGTLVTAGNLLLGNGGTSGSVEGDISVVGSLFFHRSDELLLVNNVSGRGNVYLRTGAGLVLDGTAEINLDGSTGAGNLEVGRDISGKLIVRDGASPVIGRLSLGNVSGTQGDVIQEGGDVMVSLEARLGHWPNNTSTYLLGGGTLSLTNVPTGTANERNGILYIGVDGTGVFTQTGGVATAHGIVLDNRGNTAGDDTLNLLGGTFNIGPSGIGSGGNNANASYLVNLGAGRIAATASWSTPLRMNLTGTTGDFTIDTGANTNTFSGALSGFGGLIKTGPGVLVLSASNSYEGFTTVNEGVLAVLGSVGVGFGEVRVASGAALIGTNSIYDPVVIEAGATLAPGLALGTIATLTTANTTELEGTTLMDIAKAGAVLSNDRLAGSQFLTLGGTLTVQASGDALQAGDTFQLFEAAATSGSFTSINLPPLGDGLAWDTAQLGTTGVITVTSSAQPTFITPVFSGGNVTLGGSGGTPGGSYRIVATSDLSTPLDSWMEVATGNFDASGNFSVTLPVNGTEPQKYFVVRIP